MKLSHARARELIQFQADSALGADSLRMLRSHLSSCDACRAYADSIQAMEAHLRTAMHRQWSLYPAPLNLETIKVGSRHSTPQRTLLATRFATIAAVLLFFVAGALGVMNATRSGDLNQPSLAVPLIPTPSLRTTGTTINTPLNCELIQYEVQPDDTLEFIATKFAVSKLDLMNANNITLETLTANTELIIPACQSTPTGTVRPPTFTTTITPLIDALSDTPDG